MGLAIPYHPDALRLLLVDGTGGGGFARFAALPHAVIAPEDLSRRIGVLQRVELDVEVRRAELRSRRDGGS